MPLRPALLLAALLVLLAACAKDDKPAEQAPAAAPRPALTVTVTQPQQETLRRTLPAQGTLAAWQEVIVGPEVGGYLVATVDADVGASVRKGQVLATLRTDLLAADLAARRAAREQARVALANTRAVLARAETLAGSGAISDEELDRLRTEVATAQARLQAEDANLSTAQLRQDKARIVAPDDGIVTARAVSPGQVAQVGTEMFRLMRQGRLEWRAEVPESRLGELRPGQRVRLRAADGTVLDGRIRTVAPTVRQEDRSALVYVDLPPASRGRPGQFARGDIDLGAAQAFTLPLAALVSQDGMQHVYVLGAEERVQRRRIEIGNTVGERVELRGGVEPGERVVVQGAGYLRDGDRVAVAAASGAAK